MRLQADVKPEHIALAKRGDSGHCMIAMALSSKYPKLSSWMVDSATIRATDRKRGIRHMWLTPHVAQAAIVRWDFGEEVTPFKVFAQEVQRTQIRASNRERPNNRERPTAAGPRRVMPQTEKQQAHGDRPVIEGGKLPPMAVLSDTPRHHRVFGARVLARVRDGKSDAEIAAEDAQAPTTQ